MVKAFGELFEFVFITGVVKYAQTSIFSGNHKTILPWILNRNEQFERYFIYASISCSLWFYLFQVTNKLSSF